MQSYKSRKCEVHADFKDQRGVHFGFIYGTECTIKPEGHTVSI